MSKNNLFGWDLTLKSIENDISKKEDILVAFVHWMLVKRGFSCLGIGDEKTLQADESGSELLPERWNSNSVVSLRYLYNNEVFIFHGLLSDSNIIFNLLRASDLSVSNLAININETVTALHGSIESLIPEYNELMHKIKTELIEPVTSKTSKVAETQTAPNRSVSEEPFLPGYSVPRNPLIVDDRSGILNVGRSDLNPLGGVGGGMIFDPFRENPRMPHNPGFGIPGGLPRGAVPPGARFDPFGPIGPGPMNPRRPAPDSDHLPPPGYDDMFM